MVLKPTEAPGLNRGSIGADIRLIYNRGSIGGSIGLTRAWVPEGNLAGICWVGFWGLGGPWGL